VREFECLRFGTAIYPKVQKSDVESTGNNLAGPGLTREERRMLANIRRFFNGPTQKLP
jgi:hypothetical protein